MRFYLFSYLKGAALPQNTDVEYVTINKKKSLYWNNYDGNSFEF